MPDERSTHRRELQRLPGERLLPLQVLLAPPLLPLLQHRHAELSQPSQLDAGLAEITCAARKRCLSSGCIACTGAPTVSWAATATQRSTPTTRHSRLHANDPRWAGPAGPTDLQPFEQLGLLLRGHPLREHAGGDIRRARVRNSGGA
jgi:hypothetical protein